MVLLNLSWNQIIHNMCVWGRQLIKGDGWVGRSGEKEWVSGLLPICQYCYCRISSENDFPNKCNVTFRLIAYSHSKVTVNAQLHVNKINPSVRFTHTKPKTRLIRHLTFTSKCLVIDSTSFSPYLLLLWRLCNIPALFIGTGGNS